jgi:hypothetical protein
LKRDDAIDGEFELRTGAARLFHWQKKMNAAPQFLLFSRFLFRIGGGEGVAPLAPTIAFIVLAGYSTYTVET